MGVGDPSRHLRNAASDAERIGREIEVRLLRRGQPHVLRLVPGEKV